MNELRFENTLQITEKQYEDLWTILPAWRLSRIGRFGALVAVGVLFLFTKYTLLLGLVLLALAVLVLVAPRILSFGARTTFRQHKYHREPLTYGIDEQKMWVKGTMIDASVPWSMLVVWQEKEDWLILSPSGIPPLYLSLNRLKNEGVYGRVRAVAASHAPEYNKGSPGY
ncbi:MAG TPA: hypothetical protein VFR78_21030 [Pyrinomonadaceae bacterium]|nr:hypothetical protein [Pyrinomonadaceae bacterium]